MDYDDSDCSCSFDGLEFWIEPPEHMKVLYDEIYKEADTYTLAHPNSPNPFPPPTTPTPQAPSSEQAITFKAAIT